jgi:hypothetical protein
MKFIGMLSVAQGMVPVNDSENIAIPMPQCFGDNYFFKRYWPQRLF